MMFFRLFLVLFPLLASGHEEVILKQIKKPELTSFSTAIHSLEALNSCAEKNVLPSSIAFREIAEEYLRNEVEELRLMKARNLFKKADTEKLKATLEKPSEAHVHEGDYQISLLDRLLADELDVYQFCRRRSDYLTGRALSFHIAHDLAAAEDLSLLNHQNQAQMIPPFQEGLCSQPTQADWSERIKAQLSEEDGALLTQKLAETRTKNSYIAFRFASGRANYFQEQHENTGRQAGVFRDCQMKSRERIRVIEKSLKSILEKGKKREFYVLCKTKIDRLFRTEYCEHPFELTTPEGLRLESDLSAKAFRLDNPTKDAPEFEDDGTYIPIIHNKEFEWDGKSVTSLCWNKNLGIFFDEACPNPIATQAPFKSWISTKRSEDDFQVSSLATQSMEKFPLARVHLAQQPIPNEVKTKVSALITFFESAHQTYNFSITAEGDP